MAHLWTKLDEANIKDLKGKVIKEITIDPKHMLEPLKEWWKVNYDNTEHIRFVTSGHEEFILFHDKSCCESSWLEDICGDFNDLISFKRFDKNPILVAEEREGEIEPNEEEVDTWFFYEFATKKGSVTIKWGGVNSPSGYYSINASLFKVRYGVSTLPTNFNTRKKGFSD